MSRRRKPKETITCECSTCEFCNIDRTNGTQVRCERFSEWTMPDKLCNYYIMRFPDDFRSDFMDMCNLTGTDPYDLLDGDTDV